MKGVSFGGKDLKGGGNSGGLKAGVSPSGRPKVMGKDVGREKKTASGYHQASAGCTPNGKPSGLKNARRSGSGYGAARA